MSNKTVTIELEVSDPVQISDGVYKTSFTHKSLEGSISFVHNAKGRDSVISGLSKVETPGLADIIALASDLWKPKK